MHPSANAPRIEDTCAFLPPANAHIAPISSDMRKHASFRSYAQVSEGEALHQLGVYLGLEPLSVYFYHLVLGPWLLNIYSSCN
jgi:hypothetical protein